MTIAIANSIGEQEHFRELSDVVKGPSAFALKKVEIALTLPPGNSAYLLTLLTPKACAKSS